MTRILVYDNYDSFTYNLVHLIEKILYVKVDVAFNDRITIDQINAYDKVIFSPGPGLPSDAGNMIDVIKTYAATKSILGVCLGHQAIGEAFGASLHNLQTVHHGVSGNIKIKKPEARLFAGMPDEITVGRYHSWIVAIENLPESLEVTAIDEDDSIMALQHRTYDVQGVQFHPESILTPGGETMMRNWLCT